MLARLARFVLAVLLIPALTGIGAAVCAPAAMVVTPDVAHHVTSHVSPRQANPAPDKHRQRTHVPCDGTSGTTNCCPAVAGCAGSIALPASAVTAVVPAPVMQTALAMTADPLFVRTIPPEPPPPKA